MLDLSQYIAFISRRFDITAYPEGSNFKPTVPEVTNKCPKRMLVPIALLFKSENDMQPYRIRCAIIPYSNNVVFTNINQIDMSLRDILPAPDGVLSTVDVDLNLFISHAPLPVLPKIVNNAIDNTEYIYREMQMVGPKRVCTPLPSAPTQCYAEEAILIAASGQYLYFDKVPKEISTSWAQSASIVGGVARVQLRQDIENYCIIQWLGIEALDKPASLPDYWCNMKLLKHMRSVNNKAMAPHIVPVEDPYTEKSYDTMLSLPNMPLVNLKLRDYNIEDTAIDIKLSPAIKTLILSDSRVLVPGMFTGRLRIYNITTAQQFICLQNVRESIVLQYLDYSADSKILLSDCSAAIVELKMLKSKLPEIAIHGKTHQLAALRLTDGTISDSHFFEKLIQPSGEIFTQRIPTVLLHLPNYTVPFIYTCWRNIELRYPENEDFTIIFGSLDNLEYLSNSFCRLATSLLIYRYATSITTLKTIKISIPDEIITAYSQHIKSRDLHFFVELLLDDITFPAVSTITVQVGKRFPLYFEPWQLDSLSLTSFLYKGMNIWVEITMVKHF